MGPTNYESAEVPEEYRCTGCGVHGCKLWRPYQTFRAELRCCDCAGKDQEKDTSEIDAEGKIPTERNYRTDQIGWLVPAVPAEDGSAFWGYTSVPPAGCAWWRRLPTRVVSPTA